MDRELSFDVLFVGGGPANLSAAIHLTHLIKKHNQENPTSQIDYENRIVVLEKGSSFGAHAISGGILEAEIMNEFLPNHLELGFPIEAKVVEEEIRYLSSKCSIKIPFIPSFLENKGNYIISLSKVVAWMAKQAEKNDVVLLKEVAAVELLYGEKGKEEVVGVKTDDRVKDPQTGKYRYPGYRLKSKVTVLGEGSAGTLTRKAIKHLELDKGRDPAIYELGVKEIYEFKEESPFPAGKCLHLMGYPLGRGKSGGAFLYGMNQNKLAIGLISHLGSEDPALDVHQDLQKLKLHPFIKKILRHGQIISYGAKTLPCGGFYSVPQLSYPGLMLVGDSAQFVDSRKLKGLHLAIRSGMMSAEVLFEAYLKKDFSIHTLQRYQEKYKQSVIYKDLKKSRHFTPALQKGIPFPGGILLGWQMLTGGCSLTGKMKLQKDWTKTKTVKEFYGPSVSLEKIRTQLPQDDKYVVDKLSDLFLSRTSHGEEQGSHIVLPDQKKCIECMDDYDAPCTKFCPAQVYEVHDQNKHIMINYSNCLHCKTCDLKCPKENIIWNLPEAGGGPQYTIQ